MAPAAVGTGIVQTLKLWNATPRFVTLKVIVPTGTFEVFDSLKASSEGLPAMTVMTVALPVAEWAGTAPRESAAGADPVSRTARRATAAPTPPSAGTATRKGKRFICFLLTPWD